MTFDSNGPFQNDVVDIAALAELAKSGRLAPRQKRRSRRRVSRDALLKTSLLAPLLAAEGCKTLAQEDVQLNSSIPSSASDAAASANASATPPSVSAPVASSAPAMQTGNAITANVDQFDNLSGESLVISSEQLLVNDTQANNETLEIVRVLNADNGSVFFDGAVIEFVADEGFSGETQFVYEVRDASGNLQQAVVTVNVAANDEVVEADAVSGAVDESLSAESDVLNEPPVADEDPQADSDVLNELPVTEEEPQADPASDPNLDSMMNDPDGENDPGMEMDEPGGESEMHMDMEEMGHDNTDGSHAHPDDPVKASEHNAALSLAPIADATHVAVNSGSWFDPATWANGEVPGEGASVVVPHGTTVTYDQESEASIFTVRVDGALEFSTETDTFLEVDTLLVAPSGSLTIGTIDEPVPADINAVIQIADNGPIDVSWDPQLLSRGVISHGAVEIHGVEKTSHLKVDVDPLQGDTSLTLQEVPEGWQVGDSIVLHGTHLLPANRDSDGEIPDSSYEDETLTITAINGNSIEFEPALAFDHDSPRDDLKAFVANFSRNVTIQTENADELPPSQRGHVLFMHSDDVDVRYAAFEELGRTDKSFRSVDVNDVENVQSDTNVQGRYSLHIHRAGVDNLDDPAILIGNTVTGSPGWGIVHHDSNALINDNAVFGAYGAAFVAETGNETGRWANNIAIQLGGADVLAKDGADTHAFDLGRNGVGFWFQGRQVEAVGNVAASAPSGQGYVYNSRGQGFGVINPDASTSNLSDALRYEDETQAQTYQPAIQSFYGNTSIATQFGLYITKPGPNQGHDVRSELTGFYAWEVAIGAEIEYTSHYILTDFDIVGTRNPGQHGGRNFGIGLGSNTHDFTINGGTIDGFDYGVHLRKEGAFATDLLSDFNYNFVDLEIINSDTDDFFRLDSGDRILSSDDLIDREVSYITDINPNDYIISFDDPNVTLSGTAFDSLGERRIGGDDDVDLATINFINYDTILREEGYWTLPDGRPVIALEQFVSDRLTGDLIKVYNFVELGGMESSRFLRDLGEPLENFYNGVLDPNNLGPVGGDDVFTVQAGETSVLNVLANDTDPEGDPLSIDGFELPLHGLLTVNDDGTFNYRADDGFEGQDHFFYFVEDNQGNADRVEVTINVDI